MSKRVFDGSIVPGVFVRVWNHAIHAGVLGNAEYVICHDSLDHSEPHSEHWNLRNLYDEEVFYGTCVARLNAQSIINTNGLIAGSAYAIWQRTNYDSVVVYVSTVKCKLKVPESVLYGIGDVHADPFNRFRGSPFLIVPDASSFVSIERLQ